jgi:hypothetical protein
METKEKIYYRLPMACSCGERDLDHLLEEANKILRNPEPKNWLTRATHWINDFQCTIELVSDMWCGVDIACTMWYEWAYPDLTDEELEEADARGEPDIVELYKFRVECDLIEHGIASAIIHIHEMHLAFNSDEWYAKWWNKKQNQ